MKEQQQARTRRPRRAIRAVCLALGLTMGGGAFAADPGLTEKYIRLGSVLDLKGSNRSMGEAMEKGLEAALRGREVFGRQFRLLTKNDFGRPSKTREAVDGLIIRNIFLFLGNTGVAPVEAAMPVLSAEGIPAVGFRSGVGGLRDGDGLVVNFRPSFAQEIGAVVDQALDNGIRPEEICAFVENSDYGMEGLRGFAEALTGKPGAAAQVGAIESVLATAGDESQRNGVGPVGFYKAETFVSRSGYMSLKAWEEASGHRCKLVVTTGTDDTITRFIGYARYKGESWVISTLSTTGQQAFLDQLKKFNDFKRVSERVILTQVVPELNSPLPIMQDARHSLGEDFGWVSAEGYIVGRLLIELMGRIEGDISRQALMQAAQGAYFDLGGLEIDLREDNQASDLVLMTHLSGQEWAPLERRLWQEWSR